MNLESKFGIVITFMVTTVMLLAMIVGTNNEINVNSNPRKCLDNPSLCSDKEWSDAFELYEYVGTA